MKKKLLMVAVVICMLATFLYTGRDGKTAGGPKEEIGKTDLKETIYFWYTDESMTDFLSSACVAYGERNNIRVIPMLKSESEYLEALNDASLHSGQVPDVYLIRNDSLEKAYLAGLASHIMDTGKLCNTTHFPQTALSAVTYKDKMIAYPFYYETSAFVYNKNYVEAWVEGQLAKVPEEEEAINEEEDEVDLVGEGEAVIEQEGEIVSALLENNGIPTTVDEVLVFADNYDAPENVEAVFRWDVSDIFYNYFYVGNYMIVGGEDGDDETKISISNEETKKCLEIYQALNQFFYIESDTVSYDSVVQDFIDGKIVFTVATTDVIKRLEDAKQEGTFAYEYGIARVPRPSRELDGKSLSVTTCVVVNGYSENKEVANDFAAFLTGEYYENLYDRCNKVSANYAANKGNEGLAVFMQEYENSRSLPKLIETSHFWIQLEILFSRVWDGGDAEQLLWELDNRIKSQFQ